MRSSLSLCSLLLAAVLLASALPGSKAAGGGRGLRQQDVASRSSLDKDDKKGEDEKKCPEKVIEEELSIECICACPKHEDVKKDKPYDDYKATNQTDARAGELPKLPGFDNDEDDKKDDKKDDKEDDKKEDEKDKEEKDCPAPITKRKISVRCECDCPPVIMKDDMMPGKNCTEDDKYDDDDKKEEDKKDDKKEEDKNDDKKDEDVRELLEKAAERLREDGRLGVPGDVMATIIDRIVMVASESDDLSIDSVDAASNVLVQVIDSVRQAGGSA